MVERGSLCPGTHQLSWETRGRHRYYFRTFTVEGRKVHKYVGKGPKAERQAALDELRYEERKTAQQADRDAKTQVDALEARTLSLFDLADLLGRASLVGAGFYDHHGGEWRRRQSFFNMDQQSREATEEINEQRVAAQQEIKIEDGE